MKTRILVAAVGLPLLLVIVLALPAAATAVLVAAMCVLAVYELLDAAGFCKHVRIFAYSSCMAVMVCVWSLLELPRALHGADLYFHCGAANGSPGKPVHEPHSGGFFNFILNVFGGAEILMQLRFADPYALFAFRYVAGGFPAYGSDAPFERTHAGFARVFGNNEFDCFFGYGEHGLLESVLFKLLGDEMAKGDLNLFIGKIARHFDYLHAVAQRFGDVVKAVRGRDEHYLRKIVRHFKEMIAEGEILRAVEHFEHRGGRIALIIL